MIKDVFLATCDIDNNLKVYLNNNKSNSNDKFE